MRPDGRGNDKLRSVSIERNYIRHAEGSALIAFGATKVLCTATVDERIPPFLKDRRQGWVTAEYAMLPRSSQERVPRDAVKKGRSLEISRFIGRSLRAVVDRTALGERQILVDCDVIQADGGTRTASVTGAYIALHDALQHLRTQGKIETLPLLGQCAAVSLGIIEGEPRLDLCYEEDAVAEVDMNLVMRSDRTIIEVQGSAEGKPFDRSMLDELIDLGEKGMRKLFALQAEVLNRANCDAKH
ncbi:MAG: ribonuclease PH [Candidatus Hydrogenedentes bacterium]|nr:ribonuclease PH [Candidatus Hydrogenedentota bacterium]